MTLQLWEDNQDTYFPEGTLRAVNSGRCRTQRLTGPHDAAELLGTEVSPADSGSSEPPNFLKTNLINGGEQVINVTKKLVILPWLA